MFSNEDIEAAEILNAASRLLDEQNVPKRNRQIYDPVKDKVVRLTDGYGRPTKQGMKVARALFKKPSGSGSK